MSYATDMNAVAAKRREEAMEIAKKAVEARDKSLENLRTKFDSATTSKDMEHYANAIKAVEGDKQFYLNAIDRLRSHC